MKIQKILIVCLLIVFLVGCKTEQNQSTDQQVNGQQASGIDSSQAKTETQSQSSSSSEFTEFLSRKAKLQWKINYEVNAETKGEKSSYAMTQYIKGAKLRIDSAMGGYETRMYFADDAFTSCSQENNNWNCIKISAPKDNVKEVEKGIETETENYNVMADGSKTVAGTNTKCYKITDKANSFTLRECFSNDGLPLYSHMTDKDFGTEMTATSFSKSVSDAEFELPAGAQTQELPTQGGSFDPCSACNYLSGEEKEQCLADCGG